MFHFSRWKHQKLASALSVTLPVLALSVLALSAALTSQAFAAGKTITAVMHADLRTPGAHEPSQAAASVPGPTTPHADRVSSGQDPPSCPETSHGRLSPHPGIISR